MNLKRFYVILGIIAAFFVALVIFLCIIVPTPADGCKTASLPMGGKLTLIRHDRKAELQIYQFEYSGKVYLIVNEFGLGGIGITLK